MTQDEAFEKIQQVVEGHETVKTAYQLSIDKKVDMPIMEAIYNILHNKNSITDEINQLLNRPIREEFY